MATFPTEEVQTTAEVRRGPQPVVLAALAPPAVPGPMQALTALRQSVVHALMSVLRPGRQMAPARPPGVTDARADPSGRAHAQADLPDVAHAHATPPGIAHAPAGPSGHAHAHAIPSGHAHAQAGPPDHTHAQTNSPDLVRARVQATSGADPHLGDVTMEEAAVHGPLGPGPLPATAPAAPAAHVPPQAVEAHAPALGMQPAPTLPLASATPAEWQQFAMAVRRHAAMLAGEVDNVNRQADLDIRNMQLRRDFVLAPLRAGTTQATNLLQVRPRLALKPPNVSIFDGKSLHDRRDVDAFLTDVETWLCHSGAQTAEDQLSLFSMHLGGEVRKAWRAFLMRWCTEQGLPENVTPVVPWATVCSAFRDCVGQTQPERQEAMNTVLNGLLKQTANQSVTQYWTAFTAATAYCANAFSASSRLC